MPAENERPPYRQFPEETERVETGAVRFGDDWPGVFIRGDNAGWFAHQLRTALEHLPPSHVILKATLLGLAGTLESSDMRRMRETPDPQAPEVPSQNS